MVTEVGVVPGIAVYVTVAVRVVRPSFFELALIVRLLVILLTPLAVVIVRGLVFTVPPSYISNHASDPSGYIIFISRLELHVTSGRVLSATLSPPISIVVSLAIVSVGIK